MILNLTQHAASAEQRLAGVADLQDDSAALVRAALDFDSAPAPAVTVMRAMLIADIASKHPAAPGDGVSAMIGGAPWLMGPLAAALRDVGIAPLFAFSVRESVDVAQADGSIRKTAVFRHRGWVVAWRPRLQPTPQPRPQPSNFTPPYRAQPEGSTMTTHTLPMNTLAPRRPVLNCKQRPTPSSKLIFSRAPASMGFGRPAQSAAAQP